MGADLYLEPLYKEARAKLNDEWNFVVQRRNEQSNRLERFPGDESVKSCLEKAQQEVERVYGELNSEEFYFRDSYNDSSVLFKLGLSWWEDIVPLLTKDGRISPRKCAKLADRLEKIPLDFDDFNFADWKEDTEEVRKYFEDQKVSLIKILRKAAANSKLKLIASL